MNLVCNKKDMKITFFSPYAAAVPQVTVFFVPHLLFSLHNKLYCLFLMQNIVSMYGHNKQCTQTMPVDLFIMWIKNVEVELNIKKFTSPTQHPSFPHSMLHIKSLMKLWALFAEGDEQS